jgi:hypothetical protein
MVVIVPLGEQNCGLLRRPTARIFVGVALALPFACVTSASAERGPAPAVVVISEAHHDTSPALSVIAPLTPEARDEDEVEEREAPHVAGQGGPDAALQPFGVTTAAMPATSANFAGAQNSNNASPVFPPDANGDVGPTDYVQVVNLTFSIFAKNGTRRYGPAATNTIWSGFGGLCATHNDGDPIVLYDQLANRWFISQIAFTSTTAHQCIAVSQTSDPTGAWYRYDFPYSNSVLNDYPKFGVWPDAYYMSANQFTLSTSVRRGTGVVAYERSRMIQGLSARAVYFDLGASSTTSSLSSWLPADLDGPRAPSAGEPNHYLSIQGTSLGNSADRLQMWNFHVDWTTTSNSTFTQKAVLPVAAFNANLCNFAWSCIPQSGTTAKLDPISDRLMFRNAYRNFGTYQAEVVNHTVNVGSNRAGIRWYELRNPAGTPAIFQQGTYAGDTTNSESRWMGSAALDKAGNIAIGYSVSSGTVFPSIRYVGRLASDPAGTLPQGEATMVAGTGSQTVTNSRWGDYSMLSVDPSDDCTFWYTQEYYATSGSNWQTRIGSFKFPSCGTADTTPPVNPAISSTSHTVGRWSRDNTVDLTWSGASDTGGSGIKGVSYLWAQNATTVPDKTIDTTGSAGATTSLPLADGLWYFHLATVDNAGNWSSPAHVGPFQIDTTPPTVPTSPAISGVTATQATLSWTAATDAVGVTGYKLYLNGSPLGTAAGSPFTFTNLTCATAYTFGVAATDAAGNTSGVASTSRTTANCQSGTPGTPTIVGTLNRVVSPSTASDTVNLSPVAAGDQVAVVLVGSGTRPAGVSDNLGNTYTVDAASGTANAYSSTSIYRFRYATAQPSLTLTVTWTGAIAQHQAVVIDMPGLASPPVDVTAVAGGSTTTASVTSPATTQAADVAIVAFRVNELSFTGSGWPPAGWTVLANNFAPGQIGHLLVAYRQLNATGTQTASFLLGAIKHWSAALAVYRGG